MLRAYRLSHFPATIHFVRLSCVMRLDFDTVIITPTDVQPSLSYPAHSPYLFVLSGGTPSLPKGLG
ncbi:MAG: hypothetical protein LBU46_05815 [Candidatus Accumulibacter sp.]|nr:hypothetical protein [Accumulibacter sp.]